MRDWVEVDLKIGLSECLAEFSEKLNRNKNIDILKSRFWETG